MDNSWKSVYFRSSFSMWYQVKNSCGWSRGYLFMGLYIIGTCCWENTFSVANDFNFRLSIERIIYRAWRRYPREICLHDIMIFVPRFSWQLSTTSTWCWCFCRVGWRGRRCILHCFCHIKHFINPICIKTESLPPLHVTKPLSKWITLVKVQWS